MDCEVIRDLIPLCIDGCCSEESKKLVEEHIGGCESCKKIFEDMKMPAATDTADIAKAPITFQKVNDWKASVLQSVLLFLSFALLVTGVALESKTPNGPSNGFWAVNLIIPSTAFMLSLANWYFVRVYKSRKRFSACSMLATLAVATASYIWAGIHYKKNILDLFGSVAQNGAAALCSIVSFCGIGIVLTVAACVLSKVLSAKYAKMLGKD